jgi:hypothetical protein
MLPLGRSTFALIGEIRAPAAVDAFLNVGPR